MELFWWLLLAFAASQTLGNAYYYHRRSGFSEFGTWIAIAVPFAVAVIIVSVVFVGGVA